MLRGGTTDPAIFQLKPRAWSSPGVEGFQAGPLGALEDLKRLGASLGDDGGHLRPLIAGIGEDALDEGEELPRPAQHLGRAVAVLHVGRMNDAQEQAERVDEEVALAALDLLAGIEP